MGHKSNGQHSQPAEAGDQSVIVNCNGNCQLWWDHCQLQRKQNNISCNYLEVVRNEYVDTVYGNYVDKTPLSQIKHNLRNMIID